ncbi:hypothetical protein ABKN59_010395 [Abortiporus biennis]
MLENKDPSGPALPAELLVLILGELDFKNILVCRLLSRYFREIIDQSLVLQYAIELALNAMEDVPYSPIPHLRIPGEPSIPPEYSKAEKLQILRRRQYLFHTLREHNYTTRIETSLLEHNYGLCDGVLTEVLPSGRDMMLRILPSVVQGIKERQWMLKFDFNAGPYVIDLAQDLIIILEIIDNGVFARPCTTHNGSPHPLASNKRLPIILPERSPPQDTSSLLLVAEDLFGILCNRYDEDHQRIIYSFNVINWKTGALVLSMLGDRGNSFAFLDSSHVVLLSTGEDKVPIMTTFAGDTSEIQYPILPSLIVIRCLPDTDSQHSKTTTELGPPIIFSLPLTGDVDNILEHAVLHCDPQPMWTSALNPPFQVARTQRIFVAEFISQPVNEDAENNNGPDAEIGDMVKIFIPYSTLSQHVERIEKSGNNSSNRVITWEEWGITGTRVIQKSFTDPDRAPVVSTFGTSYSTRSEKDDYLTICDFNQYAVRHYMSRLSLSGKTTSEGWKWHNPSSFGKDNSVDEPVVCEVVSGRTTTSHDSLLFPDVSSELSYLRYKTGLPLPDGYSAYLSEDSILLIGEDDAKTISV